MFMFTFSVITISIVGLFFQIVTALTAYFLSQQLALGEQMLKWHSLAFEYSCTTAGLAEPIGTAITTSDFGARATELGGSYVWNTVFFNGTYAAAPRRMIVTYVTPAEKPNGFTVADVARQLSKVTNKQLYHFNRSVAGQTVNFTTYDGGVANTISIGDLPPAVVPNSVVLVTDATCS
jgi:hypothetical protein